MAGTSKRRFHESTSRGLCRLAWLGLGVLPLLATLAFCAVQFMPSYQTSQAARWEQRLELLLGSTVQVASVQSLTPTKARLLQVRVLHPETGLAIAQLNQVDFEQRGGQWLIQIDRAEVEGRRLAQAAKLIHDSLLCKPQRKHAELFRAISLSARELVVNAAQPTPAIAEVLARVYPTKKSTILSLDFDVVASASDTLAAGLADDQRTQLVLERMHEEGGLETRAQLRTGSRALPCSLVAMFWPEVELLGSQAEFQGVIDLALAEDKWRVMVGLGATPQLTAQSGGSHENAASRAKTTTSSLLINNVDFGRLCWASETELTGRGMLWLSKLNATNERLGAVAGQVRLGPGRASRELFDAAATHLGVVLAPALETSAARQVSFDEVNCSFYIEPSAFYLGGGLAGGGIAADAHGNLAARQAWGEPIALGQFRATAERLLPRGLISRQPVAGIASRAMMWLPVEKAADVQGVYRTASEGQLSLFDAK